MMRRTRSPDGGPPPARLARRPVPLAALLLLAATATLRAEDLPAPMTHEAIEARRLHQERLEEHLARNPADRTARIGLADVMAERRFLRDAVRELGRVLAADSSRVDLWRRQATWLRELGLERGERELLFEALACYEAMLHLGPRSGHGDGDLAAAAGLALALDEPDAAEALAADMDPAGSLAPLGELLDSCAAYRLGRLEEAARRIDWVRATLGGPLAAALDGVELAGPGGRGRAAADAGHPSFDPGAARPGFVELASPGLSGVVHAADRADPEGLRLQGFWKSQDPTPTTAVNERYLEHCTRVLVADALFSRRGVPGHDTDRGRTTIRYGSPTSQMIEGADLVASSISRAAGYREPKSLLKYPRITWRYDLGPRALVVMFDDLTFQGDFCHTSRSGLQADLLEREVPSIYAREVPGGLVRVTVAEARFMGLRRDVLVALGAALPARELEAAAGEERESWSEVEFRWAVFDSAWRMVAEESMRLEAPECVYRDAEGRAVLLARADLDLPAGRYIVATEVRDPVTGKEGMVKRETVIEQVEGLLSDIELCRDVRRVEAPGRRPFVRYDAQVIPNPRCEVAAGDPLRFYYEIYGLARSPEETRRCRIRYRVLNLAESKGRQPVYPLAYSFDTDEPAGRYDIFTPRVGELDVSALRPGRYELEVRVEDLVSGKTEERKLRFVKRS